MGRPRAPRHGLLRLDRDHARRRSSRCSIPGDEVIIFEPFYENYGPGLHHLRRQARLRAARAAGLLVRPGPAARGRSRRARAPSSSTARTTRRARSSRGGAGDHRGPLPASTTCSRSPTRSTSTSSTTASATPRSPRCPGMADRTITISGISKSYSVTGWRIGYAIARPELAVGIRRAHDFVTVGAPHPLQEAAVTALGLPDSYYVGLREALPGPARSPAGAAREGRLRAPGSPGARTTS